MCRNCNICDKKRNSALFLPPDEVLLLILIVSIVYFCSAGRRGRQKDSRRKYAHVANVNNNSKKKKTISGLISHGNIRQHIELQLQRHNPQQIYVRDGVSATFIFDIYTFKKKKKKSNKSRVDASARLFLIV